MSSYLKNFMLPGVVIMLVLAFSVRVPGYWVNYRDLLLVLPLFLFAVTGAVALYLLQHAYLYTALLFASAYLLIQLHLQTTLTDPITLAAYLYITLMFPLLLMAIVILGRNPLRSIAAVVLVLAISTLFWVPYVFWYVDTQQIQEILPAVFFTPLYSGTWFSVGMLLTFVPTLFFLLMLYWLNPAILQAHWLLGLVMLFLVFVFFSTPFISSLSLTVYALLIIIALFQEAFQLAFIDELTGIPGRKALQKKTLNLGRRYTMAMLDIDHFKQFNDTYGHDVGDQVLRLVAAKINEVAGGGKAYRYGGEEFTIVFPGKTAEQALPYLEAVRENIAGYTMLIRDQTRPDNDKHGKKQRKGGSGKGVKVTVSIGVAERDNKQQPDEVLKVADTALYSAKKSGRNCVSTSKQSAAKKKPATG